MAQGFDDEIEKEQEESKVVNIDERKKRKPFAYWEVGGREYKLKLTTSVICQLEDKFKRNLLDILSLGVPPLNTMLTITQAAMKPGSMESSMMMYRSCLTGTVKMVVPSFPS